MTALARRERTALSDLFLAVGPDQPTVCAGWTTRDLAAHLVVRERRPDAGAGLIIPGLREHGERVRLEQAAKPFEATVAELRDPPWWSPVSNSLVDNLTNTAEFFIHHEDVRRAGPEWQPRPLTTEDAMTLWKQTRFSGRFVLSRLHLPVRVVADGFGQFEVGTGPLTTITGDPGELTLFLSGRQRISRAKADGPHAEELRTASLGA